ncbi:hypothetical protein [Thermaurantiacus sp.]
MARKGWALRMPVPGATPVAAASLRARAMRASVSGWLAKIEALRLRSADVPFSTIEARLSAASMSAVA